MFRTIETSIWTDPKVSSLASDGKLLFVYLVTNSHGHLGGIYYLPRVLMQLETGIAKSRLDTLCDTLSDLGLVKFDTAREVVWVVNMLRYQGRGDKVNRSVAKHVQTLHKSCLIKDFATHYPEVSAIMEDTLCDTLSDTPSTQEQEQEQIKKQNKEKGTEGFLLEDFQRDGLETFQRTYPKNGTAYLTEVAWVELAPDQDTITAMLESARGWAEYAQREGETYVPNPWNWIRDRRWTETPPKPTKGDPFA